MSTVHSPQLSFRWHTRVDEISAEWRQCFGDEHPLRGYALQKVVEDANLEGVEHHYLVVKDGKGVAAVIPCYGFELVLVTISSPGIQKIVGAIRKVFPSFMKSRLFVVGSAITTYGDLLGFKDIQDESRWPAAKVREIFAEILRKAKALKIGFTIVKELDETVLKFLEARLDQKMFFVESLPTTHLNVAPRERGGYLQSIRTRYRNKLKKRKSVSAENGMSWEIAPSIAGLEDRAFRLYDQVMEHADQVFERLNKNFFVKASEGLKGQAFYVLGYHNKNNERKLVSCEFVLCEKDTLYPLYSGFDYFIKRDSDLYFNVFYSIIDEAERRGFTKIHFGQTSYEVKAELGCECEKLFVGVYHSNPLIRGVIWLIRGVLFPKVSFPQRDVFATPPEPKKTGQKKQKIIALQEAAKPGHAIVVWF